MCLKNQYGLQNINFKAFFLMSICSFSPVSWMVSYTGWQREAFILQNHRKSLLCKMQGYSLLAAPQNLTVKADAIFPEGRVWEPKLFPLTSPSPFQLLRLKREKQDNREKKLLCLSYFHWLVQSLCFSGVDITHPPKKFKREIISKMGLSWEFFHVDGK